MTRSARLRLTAAALAALTLLPALASAEGATKWYLAEGATTAFFIEEIAITNPNGVAANVTITFMTPSGSTVTETRVIEPTSRDTIRVNDFVPNEAVSTVVESSVDVLVERSMYFIGSERHAGHNAFGVTNPSTTWYFAEGSTGFFQCFLLLSNPDTTNDAQVKVTFLRTDGEIYEQVYTVARSSRHTIWVNEDVPGFSNRDFSTVIESQNGVGIIAERAMYWNAFTGGHDTTGVPALSTTWLFAEGNTASGFDTFMLLANPGAAPAEVRLTFFPESGAPFALTRAVGPRSRDTVWVNTIPEMQNKPFSILVESTNAVPIVAERAVYWNRFGEGHASTGLTGPATGWGFAEGLQDGHHGQTFHTYYLFANATTTPATVTGTFYREDGTGVTRTFTIAPQSRYTLFTGDIPELSNQEFGAVFQSSDAVPFIAERAVYWGPGYTGGHGSTGVPWTRAIGTPAAPPAAAVASIAPTFGSTEGGARVTLTGSNFARGASVTIGGVPATNVTVVDATTIVATTSARTSGPADVVVTSNNAASTLPGAFTYVPAGPPAPPPCSAIVCDDLSNGTTVGQRIGGGFNSFGFFVSNPNAGIVYDLPTITDGYFQFEVTGMRGATSEDKWKIFGMWDGGPWSSDNVWRASVENRFRPDQGNRRFLRMKFITGDGRDAKVGVPPQYVEVDTAENFPWNPSEVYTFRMEWGSGRVRFTIQRADGSYVGVIDEPYRNGRPYAPPSHKASIGNPVGGDHGSFPGMSIRNVRIGRR